MTTNPLIDRANRWIEDEESLIVTAIELKESVETKSDWTVTVHKADGKKVEEYVIKGKTEEEAQKEASDKIKGNKELRATFQKATAKIKESEELKEDAENDEYFEKGDLLKVTGYTSGKGKGLSYNSMDAVALESGHLGSWDVVDVKNIKTGAEESIYSFSIASVRPAPMRESFIDKANKYLAEDYEADFEPPIFGDEKNEVAVEEKPEESFNDWWNRVDEIQILEFYDEHTGKMYYEIHGLNTNNEDDVYVPNYLSGEEVKELVGDNWKKYVVKMWDGKDN